MYACLLVNLIVDGGTDHRLSLFIFLGVQSFSNHCGEVSQRSVVQMSDIVCDGFFRFICCARNAVKKFVFHRAP